MSYRQSTNGSRVGGVACNIRTKIANWKKLTDTVTNFIAKDSLAVECILLSQVECSTLPT